MSKIININKNNDKPFIKKLKQFETEKRVRKEAKPVIVVEFSWKLILLVLVVLGIVFWSKQILTMLIFLFLSFVVMSAVLPIVKWLIRKKISKVWAVVITYVSGILVFLSLVSIVVVPLIREINKLVDSIPIWIKSFLSNTEGFGIGEFKVDPVFVNKIVMDWFERLTFVDSFESIAATIGGLFGWTTLVLASIVVSIYLVIDHNNILDFALVRISSDEKRHRVRKLVLEVEEKLGRWLLGQALISFLDGLILGSIIALFGIPFALPMGVFIALLSAIPTLGALFSVIPPMLISLVISGPLSAFLLLLIFVVYQQIQNNLVTPKIMGNAVGVRPILVLFAAITFLILFGVWGAVIAVPAIVLVRICYEFYIDLQKIQAKGSI